ncbi:MAG: hypothetical protein J6M24_05480 [Lachnospiraceae bacterium]|nr:hypothetical protein [Lachnospiraceae bacterium]
MPQNRFDKRVELLKIYSNDQVKKLSDKIQELKKPDKDGNKQILTPEILNQLIELYQNCAIEIKHTYDSKKKKREDNEIDKKALKKMSKDYTALLRYKKRVEKNPEAASWSIMDFYENSKTKTVTMDASEFANLKTAGAGQSTRFKLNFIVDDEPIEGKTKGDACMGFFTQGESKDPNLTNRERLNRKKSELIAKLDEKYPGTREFLLEIDDDWSAVRHNATKNMYDMMRNDSDSFGTTYSISTSKKMIGDAIKKANPGAKGIKMAQKVDNIDTEEKFCAYKEYVSSMLKEEFAMGVRSTLGITESADHGKRNAMTSSLADYFGCGEAFAFSENMRIKVKDSTGTKTMKGTLMMPAKGVDPLGENSTSDYSNVTAMNFEKSTNIVKNIAQIQFLDYLLGNPDRHAGNLFIQIDEKTKKVIGAQAIDNDTCGGSKIDAHTEMSGVSFSKLRVIPQSMADAVLNTKPEMFAVLMQGYDLSDNEITAQTARFMDTQKKLKYCKRVYEGVNAQYLDPDIPRIVPDDKLDSFYVSEQLAYTPKKETEFSHSNLFSKLTTGNDLTYKNETIRNDIKNCKRTATEISEAINVDLKNSIKDVKAFAVEENPFEGQPGYKKMVSKRKVSKELRTAYNEMVKVCDELNAPEYHSERLIEPVMENKIFAGFGYSEKMAPLKETYIQKLTAALEANQKYIDTLYDEIDRKSSEVSKRKLEEQKQKQSKSKGKKKNGKAANDDGGAVVQAALKDDVNKYDEYVSSKAFLDYYEKNLGKDSEEYRKEKMNYDKLRKDPDIRMVEAAVKNREVIINAIEKFEKLDKTMETLKTGLKEINAQAKKEAPEEQGLEGKKSREEEKKEFQKKARAEVRKLSGGAKKVEDNIRKMKNGKMNLDEFSVKVSTVKRQVKTK